MVRLFDLHAVSCAGDTLIAIGLAGTIFFNVPLGEARSKVALYLLVTMVPFAMLAPVVGPLLDHFRHGRRYALATTMLGRAFLAWLISDYIHGFGLYPAAFGVLALSRAYGVARSAAVPRLLPEGLGLSQVGARASVYGTVAGALVAPIGLAAFWFGPQWPLRVASVIFLIGMVIALRLPPKADSEPPERVPRPLRALRRRGGERPLGRGRPAGRLVISALIGAATLRGGLRLPAALPRLHHQGGRPDHGGVRSRPGRRGGVGPGRCRAGRRHLPGHRARHPAAHPPTGRAAGQWPGHRRRGGGVRRAELLAADGRPVLRGRGPDERDRQARRGRVDPGTNPGTAAGQFLRPLGDGADARLRGRRRAGARTLQRPDRHRRRGRGRGARRRAGPGDGPTVARPSGSADGR